MKIHLFWIDRNWETKGYANNYNLVVDFEKKTYLVYQNPFYDYRGPEDIQVVKKSDIKNYIEHLKKEGFKEIYQ